MLLKNLWSQAVFSFLMPESFLVFFDGAQIKKKKKQQNSLLYFFSIVVLYFSLVLLRSPSKE